MSAEKKYTEREMVLAKREAWSRAMRDFGFGGIRPLGWRGIDAEAKRAYPLPAITRPRIVRAQEDGVLAALEYRVIDGEIEWRRAVSEFELPEEWHSVQQRPLHLTAFRVRLAADLLANPNETVEADE